VSYFGRYRGNSSGKWWGFVVQGLGTAINWLMHIRTRNRR
jgi:hypothetical protein